jgi:hypothetical protein
MERVRFYQIFSMWIFAAAVAEPWTGISLFPLLVATAPFGLPVNTQYGMEYLWKNLYGFGLHAVPFIWTRWVFDLTTLSCNVGLVCVYLLLMNILGADIARTYELIMTQRHKSLADFVGERFGMVGLKGIGLNG